MKAKPIPEDIDQKYFDRTIKKIKIKNKNQCWLWHRKILDSETIIISIKYKGKRIGITAKRLLYFYFKKENPGTNKVFSTCGNVNCFNPDHMRLFSNSELILKNHKNVKYGIRNNSPRTILTMNDARKIRKMIKMGFKYREISKLFDTHPSTITRIKKNQLWV